MIGFFAALKFFAFLALTLTLMPFQFVILMLAPRRASCLPLVYHRILTRVLGISVQIEGKIPAPGGALLVANHVSWLDIVIISSLMPVSFIAKQEVARWPLFGWMAKLQRTTFVNRDQRTRTAGHKNEIALRLGSNEALVLFPEGTSGDGLNVQPFKSAFFGAAENPSVAIYPLTLAYRSNRGLPVTRRIRPMFAWYGDMTLPQHLWNYLSQGPLNVIVKIHAATTLEQSGNRKTTSLAIQNLIQDSLARLTYGR
jgi:lyso-ornithine lipid O-acyltransferase